MAWGPPAGMTVLNRGGRIYTMRWYTVRCAWQHQPRETKGARLRPGDAALRFLLGTV